MKTTFIKSVPCFLKLSKVKLHLFLLSLLAVAIFSSCTKDLVPNIPEGSPRIIVDGYIETGTPPIVLLTRSSNVFGDLDINNLGSFFLHDAKMSVKSGADSVALVEYCLKDLPLDDSTKTLLLKSLGVSAYDSSAVPNVCIYSVPDAVNYFLTGSCSMLGQENRNYDLKINYQNQEISATTTIPTRIPPDSLSWRPHPNALNDTLCTVYVHLNVPNDYGHFVRYWTKRNDEPYYPPLSGSVFDDKLFAGANISLPIERGQSLKDKFDRTTYTYFWKGDTVTLKWGNIDSKAFDFFYTWENDGTGNPFSNPVKVKSNINGAFGVWVGYGVTYRKIVVPK